MNNPSEVIDDEVIDVQNAFLCSPNIFILCNFTADIWLQHE
jgi:hypothetical protein